MRRSLEASIVNEPNKMSSSDNLPWEKHPCRHYHAHSPLIPILQIAGGSVPRVLRRMCIPRRSIRLWDDALGVQRVHTYSLRDQRLVRIGVHESRRLRRVHADLVLALTVPPDKTVPFNVSYPQLHAREAHGSPLTRRLMVGNVNVGRSAFFSSSSPCSIRFDDDDDDDDSASGEPVSCDGQKLAVPISSRTTLALDPEPGRVASEPINRSRTRTHFIAVGAASTSSACWSSELNVAKMGMGDPAAKDICEACGCVCPFLVQYTGFVP